MTYESFKIAYAQCYTIKQLHDAIYRLNRLQRDYPEHYARYEDELDEQTYSIKGRVS